MKKTMVGDVPVNYFLNDEIKVEKSAVEELEKFLEVQDTISELDTEGNARVSEVVTAVFK